MRLLILLSLLALSRSGLDAAESLSVNFYNGADVNALTEKTGLVARKDWVNLRSSEKGSHQVPRGPKISWEVTSFLPSTSPVPGVPTGYPQRLFRSQLRSNSFEEGAITVFVDDVPAEWKQRGVDVVLYWHSAATPREKPHVQAFQVNGVEKWLVSHGDAPKLDRFFFKDFATSEKALREAQTVNVVIFRNVKEFPLRIETQRNEGMGGKGGGSNGGLAAFQILPNASAPRSNP